MPSIPNHKRPCPPTCPNPRVCEAIRAQHARLKALGVVR